MEQGKRNFIVVAISAAAALAVLVIFTVAVYAHTGSAEKNNDSDYMDVLESSEYHLTNSEHPNNSESAKKSENLSSFENNGESAALTRTEQTAESDNKQTHICVFVCGKVKQAGTYQLVSGARLGACIEAAGGFSKRADREYLNLAQEAQDGQRIYVPSKKEVKKLERKASQNHIEESAERQKTAKEEIDSQRTQAGINLNTASKEELMQLNGIGEAKADAIIGYRKEHNGFSSKEELMQISGIKEGVYQKICNDITI